MRILLIETVSALGGAQWSLCELAQQLALDGHDVLVAVPSGPLQEKLREGGVAVATIAGYRMRRHPRFSYRTLLRRRATVAVRRLVREFTPDVLHANSIAAGLVALPLANVKPLVCQVRDLVFEPRNVAAIARRAQRIVASSEIIDSCLAEFLQGSSRSRLTRVVNGINLAHFTAICRDQCAARLSLALPAAPLVVMIAHLAPWKRHDLFLEVAAIVARRRPEVHFAVVGRDLLGEHASFRKLLRQTAARSGFADKIHWFEDLDDVRVILQAADLLLHPPAAEPFGRVLCEAQALGRPVVAVRAGGAAALVAHNVTGILTDNTAAALAAGAVQLLDDPTLAVRLGATGRRRVAQLFTITRCATEMAGVYQAAIAAVQ